jgi:predicted Ser/Thr protein kinase
MSKKVKIDEAYLNNFGINLDNCTLLGEGHHGKVYLIADDRVIKVCRDSKSCIYESFIFSRVRGSKHFPKVYDFDEHYIVRDYVGGQTLAKYIKANGINKGLVLKIIELLEEFDALEFTKLDIRCKDVMIQDNGLLMVIDPKSCYTRKVGYPRHLMKGLKKLGALEAFTDVLKEVRPDLYEKWIVNPPIKKS